MPPNELSQNPTLADVISGAIEARLDDLYTAMPGVVMRGPGTQNPTLDVQPTISKSYQDESGKTQYLKPPLLRNVPVMLPVASQDYYISHPIMPGDHVLLVLSNSPMDEWKERTEARARGVIIIDPKPRAGGQLRDAVAIPGLLPVTGGGELLSHDAMVFKGDLIKLGGPTANQGVIHGGNFKDILKGVLSDSTVLTAINNGVGVGTAIDLYFTNHPISGSSVVKAL